MIAMTENELNSLRLAAKALLNSKAIIQRKETVDDGQLGSTEAWVNVAIDVPCRIAEFEGRGNRESSQGGRLVSEGEHTIRFPFGTVVDESNRVMVKVSDKTRTFEVSRVIEHSYATNVTVVATESR
jgi:head-tail adaptor